MSVFRPLLLVGQVTILWAMLAAILLLPGRLMISGIEADVLHALDGGAARAGRGAAASRLSHAAGADRLRAARPWGLPRDWAPAWR
ncbi:MAG: hypothetical protein KatS3mg118_1935 [Paracoccaceae bacterium]|nr:MAG: hypothetical protein KatS3mg118_1935 [Paracoccaceae bacterium]